MGFIKRWMLRLIGALLFAVLGHYWTSLDLVGWLTTEEGRQIVNSLENNSWKWYGNSDSGHLYRGRTMIFPDTAFASIKLTGSQYDPEKPGPSGTVTATGLSPVDRYRINAAAKAYIKKISSHRLGVALREGETDEKQNAVDRATLIKEIRDQEARAYAIQSQLLTRQYQQEISDLKRQLTILQKGLVMPDADAKETPTAVGGVSPIQ